ncbi:MULTISPECIES: SUMF1/EgtB/PvdO family nonheme iron enzyme [unclassified Arcicella]|uniref:formylglycine-generating enzyme family protein n=1 Tax=unclassified Arcicella TaxID=2644986 RepID=UPI0028575F2F|nr:MULTISPECIES: SUMF1/EgtB/PvdO family nonheme iron enzyme [unclassified Arcicella]MDR6562312.1 formylglycine-generating enzyme required for sulfatase activity [Arcicella sp. BE51]MDR6811993.1 formylglycine-generating enzyme required for sulfatase activity [Arcicella sp. BE140]MDR6823304.1 formylglycine-generating enzyme required for sulfatase activity [Arcicella sp. BE139]
MLSKIVFVALVLLCFVKEANAQNKNINKISDKYYHLIEAPTSADKWDEWRLSMRIWRDSTLKYINYKGNNYQNNHYKWASKAYSTYFLMANDIHLYDKNGNYDIRNCVKKYENNYGGVDVVVLWPTYPQLGFDNRTQYSFYRNLPGGVSGLKKLCDELHQMGKKMMIAYNPWDNTARNKGKTDEDELLDLLKETGADGVYLDTISNVEGFFQKMQSSNRGAVFQSEIPINPEALNQVHQSWLEVGWSEKNKHLEFAEVPALVRNRWLEQKHLIYRLSRFSHEQSTLIQNAWINGCGIVLWENVFGTVNELNPRDRSLINSMLPVQREYSVFFTEGEWFPLFPIKLNRVYASQWQLGNKKLWTIINRQEQIATGKLFEVEAVKDVKYFDLIAGKEVKTSIENGKVGLFAELKPKAIACILSIPSSELNPAFYTFLKKQSIINQKADFSTTYKLPKHSLKPVVSTKKYIETTLPKSMVSIPVSKDSVTMTFSFRQRECGFYPIGDFVDFSYSQNRNEITKGKVKAKLESFAIDKTLVTNQQFADFLKASNYKPKHSENFLKHWINNKPPQGYEQHPVVWITLDDARAYAKWAGKRLPTEIEWQWAAQNGKDETLYPWGNNYDSTLVNAGQYLRTTPVTQFEKGKTKQGLYDMSGNVWQLTESERTDGYNNYYILRGGAWYRNRGSEWYADQGAMDTSFGAKYLMTYPGLDRCATVGFRCVVDVLK